MLNYFLGMWRGLRAKVLRRSLLAASSLAVFVGLALPRPARAGVVGDVLGNVFELGMFAGIGRIFQLLSVVSFALTWFIPLVGGMFVAALGWMLQVVLAINMNVVNSTVVQTGFPVLLSVANLVFV